MVALKDVKAALHVAGDFTPQELYPAPFPEDEPTISLEKISLCKLLNGDTAESERMFNVCSTVGFFYLDMLDHALGRQTWQQACHMYRLGRERLKQTPLDEKSQYKPLGGVSVFDRGCVFPYSIQFLVTPCSHLICFWNEERLTEDNDVLQLRVPHSRSKWSSERKGVL